MNISYNWLKELSGSKMPYEQMARALTFAGLEVVSIEQSAADVIFEAEITSNRSDWLSMLGVAREICAIERRPAPDVKALIKDAPQIESGCDISVDIEDSCAEYYLAIEIEGIKVGPSPDWLVERLQSSGLRPINNIVDITNYCMLLFGQPLHAFDREKISGRKIVVRRAGDGEKIVSLDGEERMLASSDIVIADEKKAIAIAGVIGGANSEVGEDTVNVVLESARFPRIDIRKTRQRLAVNTDASYRFERGIDPRAVDMAGLYAAYLMSKLAGGKIKGRVSCGEIAIEKRVVELTGKDIRDISAIDIPEKEVSQILQGLGFAVKSQNGSFVIDVPSFRLDIAIKEDIIEEVLRIYGYDNVPVEFPKIGANSIRGISDKHTEFLSQVHSAMQAVGAYEAITFSLISEKEKQAFYQEKPLLEVENTISNEYRFLRLGPVPGLLSSAGRNIKRGHSDVFLYEISQSLSPDFKDSEKLRLGLCATGKKKQDAYKKIRFAIDVLSQDILKMPVEIGKNRPDGKIEISGFGAIGFADDAMKKAFGIKAEAAFLCLKLDSVFEQWKKQVSRKYAPANLFPAVEFDVSMWVDIAKASYQQIVDIIEKNAGEYLEKIELVDVYSKTKDKTSYAFRLFFRAKDRTLTAEEAGDGFQSVLSALSKTDGLQVRAQ